MFVEGVATIAFLVFFAWILLKDRQRRRRRDVLDERIEAAARDLWWTQGVNGRPWDYLRHRLYRVSLNKNWPHHLAPHERRRAIVRHFMLAHNALRRHYLIEHDTYEPWEERERLIQLFTETYQLTEEEQAGIRRIRIDDPILFPEEHR